MSQQALQELNYSLKIPKFILSFTLFLLFVSGFLSVFSILPSLETKIRALTTKNPACPLSFEQLDFEWFAPKIVLKNIQLPAVCFSGLQSLNLPYVYLKFGGPSFSPFGLSFQVQTEIEKQNLSTQIVLGIGEVVAKIEEEKMDLKALSVFLPKGIQLEGLAQVYIRAHLQAQILHDFKMNIESSNFTVPRQSIAGFNLSQLDLKKFALRAHTEAPSVVQLDEWILGEPQTPVRSKFSGKIKLNPRLMSQSQLDLKGEVAFSKEFLETYSVLNLLLQSFTQKDGFYQIKLGGTLAQITPSPL
jgi:hypothetical protein